MKCSEKERNDGITAYMAQLENLYYRQFLITIVKVGLFRPYSISTKVRINYQPPWFPT